mgnify:CR=1 FL=1
MTARPMTDLERRIRALLLDGQSRKRVASIMGISYGSVRAVSDRLEYLGYIRRVPGAVSPIMYYDPAVASTDTLQQTNVPYDTPQRSTLDYTAVPDPTLSRVHLAGSYTCEVLHEGTTDPIRDRAGRLLGHWRADTVAMRGRTDRYGDLTVDGATVTICLRRGKSSLTLAVWPGEVWLSGADAYNRGAQLLEDRTKLMAELLRLNGWRLGPPALKGVVHAAHVDSPILPRMDRQAIDDNAPIQPDTSGGQCEVEAFNNADNNILSYLPEHIRGLYARAKGIEDLLASLVRIQEYQAQLTATGMPILSGASDLGGMYQ